MEILPLRRLDVKSLAYIYKLISYCILLLLVTTTPTRKEGSDRQALKSPLFIPGASNNYQAKATIDTKVEFLGTTNSYRNCKKCFKSCLLK